MPVSDFSWAALQGGAVDTLVDGVLIAPIGMSWSTMGLLIGQPLVELRVYRRTSMMQLAHMTGLFPEVRTWDSLFNSEFVVFSNQGESAANFLMQPAVRQSLQALFDQGFWVLAIDRRGIWIE